MTRWQPPTENMNLDDDTVHIWLCHLNISPPRMKQFYPLLSDREKERSERFVNFIHRKRFIAAHGFMRTALASYTPQSADELIFNKSDKGKPSLINEANIQFNLSHSHNLACLAICKQHAIGVDIEYMDRKNQWQKLIRRFFTAEEQTKIFALPEPEQQQAFFQVWTRKEAHMKVTGLGLHLSPTRFTVSVPPEPPAFIEYLNSDESSIWHMNEIQMPDNFKQYCGCYSATSNFNHQAHFLFS